MGFSLAWVHRREEAEAFQRPLRCTCSRRGEGVARPLPPSGAAARPSVGFVSLASFPQQGPFPEPARSGGSLSLG